MNESEARGAIRALHKAGVDCIKVQQRHGFHSHSGLASNGDAIWPREIKRTRQIRFALGAKISGGPARARQGSIHAGVLRKDEPAVQSRISVGEAVQQAGVRVLAGTDLATAGTYPGFDLHDELALMVEAGLSPMQALQTATHHAAEFQKLTDAGIIAAGKTADLVLLDANPLEDIRNTQRIRAVSLAGRFLDRTALDGLLRDAERTAQSE